MANPRLMKTMPFLATTAITVLVAALLATTAKGLVPYTRPLLWDLMVPAEDPFRILEQTPLTMPTPTPKGLEALALMARADWKETSTSHVIKLDIPGMRRDDIKIEVEENRVLRISGERKTEEEEEVEGERWHRAERTGGKFWRQFRLPANADLDHIKAHLQDGVLKITVPKLAVEKRQPKVVNISGQDSSSSAGQDIKATKVDDIQ